MQPSRISPLRLGAFAFGGAAAISWAFALVQAAPRLLAGPLCSSSNDVWSLAGHCPACFVAAGFTLASLSLFAADQRARIAALIVR